MMIDDSMMTVWVRKGLKLKKQVGGPVKIGILWDVYTRYIDVSPPNKEYVRIIGKLHLTCGKTYVTYNTFGRSYRQFKLGDTRPAMGRVTMVWTYEKIK